MYTDSHQILTLYKKKMGVCGLLVHCQPNKLSTWVDACSCGKSSTDSLLWPLALLMFSQSVKWTTCPQNGHLGGVMGGKHYVSTHFISVGGSQNCICIAKLALEWKCLFLWISSS